MTEKYENIIDFHTLYKRGSKGEVRCWNMELGYNSNDDAGHRTKSGIIDMKHAETIWNVSEPKNVGKANATNALTQAKKEIENKYTNQMKVGYFENVNDIDDIPFTKPMLAVDIEKRRGKFNFGFGVISQPKLDGIRCIARADGLWTRTGKPIVAVPHISEALAPLFEDDPDLILDGELYNHELKDKFNELVSLVRKAKPKPADLERSEIIQYHVYDVIQSGNDDGEEKPVEARVKYYTDLINWYKNDIDDFVKAVHCDYPHNEETLDVFNKKYLKEGYEGQMVRLMGTPYDKKRSNSLMKRKEWITEEFKPVDMLVGQGQWAGVFKTLEVELPDGTTGEATFTGTREELTGIELPDWCTVKYFGYTVDGKLRFPNVVDWGYGERDD